MSSREGYLRCLICEHLRPGGEVQSIPGPGHFVCKSRQLCIALKNRERPEPNVEDANKLAAGLAGGEP